MCSVAKRIIIITQGISPVVNPLVESGVCNVIGIIECAPRKKKKKCILDTVRKNKNALNCYADEKSIPYFYMEKSDDKLRDWVQVLEPDLMVVYSMSQLLKEDIFTIPKYGTINLHPSLLPKYRGPNPDFWQYYFMDMQRGCTVHYIDKGEDTGDILLQETFEMPLGMTSPDVKNKLISDIGVKLLLSAIENIEALARTKQPALSPTPRARNIKAEEHNSIIDWQNWSIEHIWHVLRGTELWLNAIHQPCDLLHLGTRWKVGEIKKIEHSLVEGKVYHHKYGVRHLVACKDGIIVLHKQFQPKQTFAFFLRKLHLLG